MLTFNIEEIKKMIEDESISVTECSEQLVKKYCKTIEDRMALRKVAAEIIQKQKHAH